MDNFQVVIDISQISSKKEDKIGVFGAPKGVGRKVILMGFTTAARFLCPEQALAGVTLRNHFYERSVISEQSTVSSDQSFNKYYLMPLWMPRSSHRNPHNQLY